MPTGAGPRRRDREQTGALSAVGRLVTTRRLTLGLTQSELADLADASLSSVRRLEAGQDTVGLALFLAVLDALGLVAAAGPGPVLRGLADVVVLRPGRPEPPHRDDDRPT